MAKKKYKEIKVSEINNETKEIDDISETNSETDVGSQELDIYIPKHPCRKNVYKKFYDLLKNSIRKDDTIDVQKMALNIERGIFNYTIKNRSEYKSASSNSNKKIDQGISNVDNTWNEILKYNYQSRAVKIYTNLNKNSYLKNTNLINRLFNKEFTEFELVEFSPADLFPERYSHILAEYKALQPKELEKEIVEDGMFRCGKCKTYRTTYYQLQTRSARRLARKVLY
jgi:DNA-directed RNA polymerase subunit M/transcription elongation factor TFIIS